jgi:hypothetical protein
LQQFLRILKNIAQLVALRAQHLRSQLRRNLDPRDGSIFRHKSNLIDSYAWIARQRALQLLRKRTRLRVSAGKRAHKSRELRLRQIGCKVNACDSRGSQQYRETFFRRRCSQRHSVQQDLIAGSSQQQPRIPAFIQRRAQFFPRRFKLRHRPHVPEFIQPGKLQQNVQAANKRAGCLSCISSHFCGFPLSIALLLH